MTGRAMVALCVAALLVGACATRPTSMRRALVAGLSLDAHEVFEGEPVYLQVEVRNRGAAPLAVLGADALSRSARLTVRNAAGADVRRLVVSITVLGAGVPDTLAPGASALWVVPLHWFWGTQREPYGSVTAFSFSPGRYRIAIAFPAPLSIGADSVQLVVRSRSPAEERARMAMIAAEARAIADVSRSDTGVVAILRAVVRDSTLAAFHTFAAVDLGATLAGALRGYSPAYRAQVDALRLELLRRSTGVGVVRLLETLSPELLDSLIAADARMRDNNYVRQRLRAANRAAQVRGGP